MGWLAVLWIGIGTADLVRAALPRRFVAPVAGAVIALVAALGAGLTGPADLVATALLVGVVLGWGVTVPRALATRRPWPPLVLLVAAVSLAVAFSPYAAEGGGLLGRWLSATPLGVVDHLSSVEVLLLLGAILVQLVTGNVIVRLVLAVTGTVDPAPDHDATRTLKGGRVLGPLERLFILGLGLAGHLTAASIVIAAKGLLRFPELQSRGSDQDGPDIHEITEYFLVGSFVSWTLPLVTLVLLL